MMKFGLSLFRLNQSRYAEVAIAAERLGFESVWASDHLVLPAVVESEWEEHPPIPGELPVLDPVTVLSKIAAVTTTLRVGTWVYVLPLRHPFVTARAFQTLDILSNGRVEAGFGAGWLPGEFRAAGIGFRDRGARMDECLQVCRRLWSEPQVEHSGRFFAFDPVAFEPKPVQRPWPCIHVGGESAPAMRRAVRFGTGWLGTEHSPQSAADAVVRLRRCEEELGREERLEVTVATGSITGAKDLPPLDEEGLEAFTKAGVDRLIVSPWRRSADALDSLETFAERFIRPTH